MIKSILVFTSKSEKWVIEEINCLELMNLLLPSADNFCEIDEIEKFSLLVVFSGTEDYYFTFSMFFLINQV